MDRSMQQRRENVKECYPLPCLKMTENFEGTHFILFLLQLLESQLCRNAIVTIDHQSCLKLKTTIPIKPKHEVCLDHQS